MNRIALSFDGLSAAGIFCAARRVRFEASTRLIPVMGVLSAFVFAAQMLNFPVLGGTSGHLVGGALLGIVLGPMAGFLAMATVVAAQALFLQDGGLLALGANIFNIGAVTVFSGFVVYRLLGGRRGGARRVAAAGFAAGWVSLLLSAAACSLELSLSGTVPLAVGLPAMTGFHALIGLVEGGLTAGVLSLLVRVRPDLIRGEIGPGFGAADWAGGIVFVGVPLALLISIGSSALPDPLETLLAGDFSALGAAGPGSLPAAGDRYREYLAAAAVAAAVAAVVWIGGRIVRIRRSRP